MGEWAFAYVVAFWCVVFAAMLIAMRIALVRIGVVPALAGPKKSEGSKVEWDSVLEEPAGPGTITLLLRSKRGSPLPLRLACEVETPFGESARATVENPGLFAEAHVHYPDNFAPKSVMPGTYRVTWYRGDETGDWHELIAESHEVAFTGEAPA